MPEQLCKSIGMQFDVQLLLAELEQILQMVSWHPADNQISLQYRPEDADQPWYSGIGSIGEWQNGHWISYFDEKEFNLINPALKGTYFEKVLTSMPFKPVRTRIMRMPPKKCYSIHVDETDRYHLAMVTNTQARFIFTKAQRIYHIPSDGQVYYLKTLEEHTAINAGKDDRIHLVMIPG